MNVIPGRIRTAGMAGFLFLWLASAALAQQLLTPCEQSNYENYTTYEEMLDYLQAVQATSTEMLLSSFGTTLEGREQPHAIFSRPLVTRPEEAWMTGKPIVVLAANVHGGERTVRESLLILIRELAEAGSEMNKLLDDLVVIVVPSINPDGFVRATRGNSTGVDMNREYINLEQPALRNYVVNILLPWQPHIFLDGHNGGSYPYNICYQGPCNAAADQIITDLCDKEIFPFIDYEMQSAGFKSWYYSGGNRESWSGIPSFPRGSVNWGGLVNCFGILFESPSQSRADGALSGLVASRALLKYAAANPQKIIQTLDTARNRTIELGQKAEGEIAVQMRTGPKDYKVSYLIAEGRGGERELIQVTGAELRIQPVPTKTRPRPYAYLLEPRALKAVEMLKIQNITIEVLQEDVELEVEAYVPTGIARSNLNDHPAAVTTLELEDETVARTQTFPKGSFVVRTGQARGRLAAYMLEPETDDNVVTWNRMDALLPRIPELQTRQAAGQRGGQRAGARGGQRESQQIQELRRLLAGEQQQVPERTVMPQRGQRGGGGRQAVIPIYKLMTPTGLPTKILK
jgi:hypothetical protein